MIKKKVLVRVDANATIGLGHFYRCLSLAQMLESSFKIHFAMAKPSNLIQTELQNLGYSLIEVPGFEYTHPDQKPVGAELPFDLDSMLDQYDILILDGYWFGPKYLSAIQSFNASVIMIEDEGHGNYEVDIILNHALGLDSKKYTGMKHKALGASYVLLRPDFLEQAKQTLTLKTQKYQAMICFGGADFKNYTLNIAEALLTETNMKVVAITGGAYKHSSTLEKLKDTYPDRIRIAHNLSATEMIVEMKNADIGIVPSSGILMECIACRLPVITGAYAENQERIYKGFLKEEVIIDGGDFNPKWVLSQLNGITVEQQNTIQQMQQKLIDGKSGNRIKELVSTL